VKPHVVPSHEAVAFTGGEHGEHDAPHVAIELLDTHAPAHRWKPELHVNPQRMPSHVGVAFAGAVHGPHDVPHVDTLESLAHAMPQRW